HHGDEMHQLFVIDTFDGWPLRLTHAPQVQYNLAGWTPDGRHIVVTGNDREPAQMDPQLIEVATGAVTRLLTGGLYYAFKVSPDGKTLCLFEFITNTRQRLWLLDLETGEKVAVLGVPVGEGAAGEDVKAFPLAWRADSSGVYVATDQDHEFSARVFVGRETGTSRSVLREDREVEDAVIDRDGTRLAVTVNEAGATSLLLFAIDDGSERPLKSSALPVGVVESVSIHPDGQSLLVGFNEPRSATNLSIVDVGSGTRTLVEQSMLGGVDPGIMIEPSLIAYPSFDRDIPAWLYRPTGSGPFTVVLFVHGGPE